MSDATLSPARRKSRWWKQPRAWLFAYVCLFMLFVLAPLIVVIGASFEPQELMRFPPHGFSLRWYARILEGTPFIAAAQNSIIVALIATVGALILGTPAAYGIARYEFRGREAVSAFLNSPLLVPELVMGLAILQILAIMHASPSIAGLAFGHLLICLPYVVRTMNAAIRGLDPTVEEAARNLGANWLQIYTTVVLPAVMPALFASGLIAFLMSFDNAVISLFLVSARTTTLPIEIYNYIQYNLDPLIAAVSSILMAISVLIMFVASRFISLERLK